jgi:hypothetical protein
VSNLIRDFHISVMYYENEGGADSTEDGWYFAFSEQSSAPPGEPEGPYNTAGEALRAAAHAADHWEVMYVDALPGTGPKQGDE